MSRQGLSLLQAPQGCSSEPRKIMLCVTHCPWDSVTGLLWSLGKAPQEGCERTAPGAASPTVAGCPEPRLTVSTN